MCAKNFRATGKTADHRPNHLHTAVFIRVLARDQILGVTGPSPGKRLSEDGVLRSTLLKASGETIEAKTFGCLR
jgi:hypothetical protein